MFVVPMGFHTALFPSCLPSDADADANNSEASDTQLPPPKSLPRRSPRSVKLPVAVTSPPTRRSSSRLVVTPSPLRQHKQSQKQKPKRAGVKRARHRRGTVAWRLFDDGWFKGKVERRPTSEHPVYLMSHSDGDMEEMMESQIDALIQMRLKEERRRKAAAPTVPPSKKKKTGNASKKERKRKVAASIAPPSKKKKTGKASSGQHVHGIYLEMPRKLPPDAVDLDDHMVARLEEVGLYSKDWLKLATRVHNDFLRGVDHFSKYKPKEFEPLGWLPKGRAARVRKNAVTLHRDVIAPLRHCTSSSEEQQGKDEGGAVGAARRAVAASAPAVAASASASVSASVAVAAGTGGAVPVAASEPV